MKNEINYFKNAKWAMLNGAFTSADLRDIADRVDNPEMQDIPIETEKRDQEAIKKTMDEAKERERTRQEHD